MKKIILTSTALLSLLVAGSTSVSAAVTAVNPVDLSVVLTGVQTDATFKFNDEIDFSEETSFDVEALLDANEKISGSIVEVGGTLENLTSSSEKVLITIDTKDYATIDAEFSAGIELSADPFSKSTSNSNDAVAFTISKTQAIAINQSWEDAVDGEDEPTHITITAQDVELVPESRNF